MLKILIVGAGGFIGAVARYLGTGIVHRYYGDAFPLGTLTVNLIGCFALGLIMELVQSRGLFSSDMRLLVTIGLLGAFTTYSTFAYETYELISHGRLGAAGLNMAAHLFVGLVAVWLGVTLVRVITA